MSWQDDVNEIQRRRELGLKMGGQERVDRQHAQGKYTVRERFDRLFDAESFLEVGSLAGSATLVDGKVADFAPSAYVMGLAEIGGRRVAAGGEDFTVKGAAMATERRDKLHFAEQMAKEFRIPLVLLMDGAGASIQSIESMGHTYLPNTRDWSLSMDLLGLVPVVAGVVGPAAGYPAARAMLAHWVCMVRGTGQLFAAGPPVVRRAIGREIGKEELGGTDVHVHRSGVAENEATDEDDCFRQIREFLSFMPDSVWERPPYREPADRPDRREEELLTIVPENRNRPYNMRKLVQLIVDDGRLFEISPHYGRSVVAGLARMNGHVVGVMANDPRFMGGAIDGPAADKQTHFIELCDAFHIPILNFVDVPGVMVGPQAELEGTLRRGMRAFWMIYQATVPIIDIMVRKCYGMAGAATNNASRLNLRIAWPSAEWGSLPIEGGVDAAFRRDIETSTDPAGRRKELEEQLSQLRSPFVTAEKFGVEDIIDPRDTRRIVIRFLDAAIPAMSHSLGPKPRYGVRP